MKFANGVEQIQRRRKGGRGTRLKSVKQLEEREKRFRGKKGGES